MKTKIILLFITAIILASCTKTDFLSDGDYYHLDNDGAKMPLWVTGNLESDVILVTVHGGPGDTGMDFHISTGFKSLEKDYGIAYWDQRFSGIAQGDPNVSTLNADQFIEDTEKMVELIKYHYPGKKLFLLGHSWGGQLTAGYLGRDSHA